MAHILNTDTHDPETVDTLLWLAHELGHEPRQLAILGEGNVSTKADGDAFWVKASGTSLAILKPEDVSLVSLSGVMGWLEHPHLNDDAITTALADVLLDNDKKPSVETFLHALCLNAGASWVGHTHTVSINSILCSEQGATPFLQHIFPDAIVVCGHTPAVVPYVDPGFALAKAVQQVLEAYQQKHGHLPKLLLMENHGPVALGQSARDVLNIMLMADKWAKTLLGALSFSKPRYLSRQDTQRIDGRIDEDYRRKQLTASVKHG